MLSILIPVYNFDIRALTHELAYQCADTGVPWEICCIDDGSALEYKARNREIAALPGVRYEELPANIGRAAIRNLLISRATFPYLLFMDCDAAVVRADYIAHYLQFVHPQAVLCGGRVYAPVPPAQKQYLLHWKFGRQREQIAPEVRSRHPWRAFMTNNFLAPKAIFDCLCFEERIQGYGHEDTLFGMELQARHIPVIHLNNPLEHKGLEPAGEFLRKNDEAMRNLAWLWQYAQTPVQTRLLNLARRLEAQHLLQPASKALRLALPLLRAVLLSPWPALWALDMYKLAKLLSARSQMRALRIPPDSEE